METQNGKHNDQALVNCRNLRVGQVIKSVYPLNSDYTVMEINYDKQKILMKQNNNGYTNWIDADELAVDYGR